MELLDEQGRLFGRVNVVDALVVVFAIAVIAAGAALVLADEPRPEEPTPDDETTMHVTLVTTKYGAEELEPGPAGLDTTLVNITDVYHTTRSRAYFRVALEGIREADRFRFAGNTIRVGDGYTLFDNTTSVGVTVLQHDVAESFETETTTVTVETIVRPQIAEAVAAGDEHRVGDTTIATVTDAESTPADDPEVDDGRTLTVTLELETRTVDGVPYYGGRPVRLGRLVAFESDTYRIEAEVVGRE